MLFYNIKGNIIQTSVNGSLVNFSVDETNQGSIEHVELMKDDYIELHFNSKSPVYFPIGTYCTYNSKLYYVLDKQKPSVTITGLEYKLKLESYYMKWKNILCMYNKSNGGEASWTLAGDIAMFGNVIVHILADEGIKYNGSDIIFTVDSTVTAYINTIEFSNVSIIEALNLIAEKFECEWWVTDNVIHFGKCELGTEYVKLEVGEELASNSPSNSDSKFANRIYAFGSDKNIPTTYRKHLIFTCDTIGTRNGKTTIFDSTRSIKTTYFAAFDSSTHILGTTLKFLTGAYAGNTYNVTINPDGVLNGGLIAFDTVINPSSTDTYILPSILPSQVPVSYYTADNDYVKNSVVQNSLALPSSKPYVGIEDIDDITNLDIDENDDIVPAIVTFDKEYPKLTSTVQSVSVQMINYKDSDGNILDEKYPQYTVVLNQPTNFDKKYVIGTLRCAFQSGLLAGSEYELQFNSGTSFTIVNNSDYGRQLPDLNLLPNAGDTLIMYNYDTQYFLSTSISDAELHLKQTAIDYLKKSLIDPTTYTSKRNVNNDVQLALGTKVNLIDPEHIQSKTIDGIVYGRKSRIYGYEKALDGSSLTYTVGESTIYSRLNSLESKVDSIEYNGASYQYSGSVNGASVYLITSTDTTVPSDSNTFSAQRAKKEFLSKTQADRTDYDMIFGKNIEVDGQAILNDVVANTGTFGGLLKAAAATITGALSASTVSATTMNATTFIGELQGNAATATKLQTARTIWGQSFDGSGNVEGRFALGNDCFTIEDMSSYRKIQTWGSVPLSINPSGNNVGIGTTNPLYKLDVNGNMRVTSDIYADATVGTRNFASHTTGWRTDSNGNADFRNIYADELRVQAFTADISQALAGSDYLTKSVSKLSANFVVPAVNSTVRIIVDDIEGMPATQCFTNGDYIRFRAFNRTSGLIIANVWGTVVLDTTFGNNGFSNGTQAYTFTCTQTTGAGLTVFKGSEVLDYGISGSGLITRTTLDTMGSPYEQIATWKNDPSNGNNYTVHARLGNLGGIANCNGYGIYTDNGFFTGKIVIGDLTKTANFLSFDSVNGLQVKIGGTSVATTTDVSNSLTTANTNAQGYATAAQTTAINTASSDATTKANNAYNSAVTYTNTQISVTNNSITAAVNAIQIGGRNLARNSKGDFTYNLTDIKNYTANMCYVYWAGNKNANIVVSGDVEYSNVVFTGTGSSNLRLQGTQDIGLWNHGLYFNLLDKISQGNGKFHFSFAVTDPSILNNNYFNLGFRSDYITGTVTFRNLKVEYGTKETSWSPAPEDVDASISTAQSTAISTAATNAAALYVTQTAYSSQVTILQNSINAKVSQTDFNALGTRVGTAESTITQHSTDIASKVAQTDYTGNTIASLINQTATTIQIQASKINLVGAVTFNSFNNDLQTSFNNKASSASVTAAQNTANQAITNAATAQTTATNAATAASNAQNSANTANSAISEMTSDDNITAQEKQAMKTEWDSIVSEKTKNDTHADNVGVSRTTYDNSYSTLSTTIGTNLSNLTTTWDLGSGGGATLRSQFKAYYDARTDLLNAVSTKAKTLADAAKTAADNAQGDATNALNRNNTMAVKLGYTDYTALASAAALGHTLIDGGFINTQLIQATAVVTNGLTANCITANMISSGAVTADKIAANSITSDKVNMSEFTASNGFVDSFNANVVNTKRLNVAKIVADGIAAQTIDAQSATISNLNVVNATISGYFHAEYSGGAFVRMGQPTSSKILAIRADGLTGIDIGVYGDNSTGLSITANRNSSKALDIHGSSYLISRNSSTSEGTWINGLSLCRVTITSGGDLGFGSLGWYQNGGYYMPNFIVSKASSNISVYIPADMPDGAVLIFRNAGGGTLNVSSKNFADKFQWGSQWGDWSKPYASVAHGVLNIYVYDKSSYTWYVHGIS